METSFISKNKIRDGEQVIGEDLRKGIFDLIKNKFPYLAQKNDNTAY